MKNKTEIFECSYKGKYQDIVGLTLGFPQKSTIIFQLENMANIDLRDNNIIINKKHEKVIFSTTTFFMRVNVGV